MSFAEELAADRRLVMLRLIEEAGGSANESVLHRSLHQAGHNQRIVTRDVVRADMRLLAERGCVTLDWFEDKVCVASITSRGLDAASGAIAVADVKRPRIGE